MGSTSFLCGCFFGFCVACARDVGFCFLVCAVLSSGFCFGLMPLSYVFRGGVVRFSFFSGGLWLRVLFLVVFFGLCPFGNKFLLIQQKRKRNFLNYKKQLLKENLLK